MRAIIRPLLVIGAITAVLLGVVVLLHLWKDVPMRELTSDPVDLGRGMHVYFGFLSQVGIFFWAAAARVCLFCWSAVRRSNSDDELARFLLTSGVFTLFLAIDDVFLLHETVFPYFGIPQGVVLGSYVVFVPIYLFIFRRTILETDFLLLALAISLFAISVGLDVFKPFRNFLTFFEDGAKLAGIVSWAVYFFCVGRNAIDSLANRRA